MYEQWLVQLGWLQYKYQGYHDSPLYPAIAQLEWLGHYIQEEKNILKIQEAKPVETTRFYNVKGE